MDHWAGTPIGHPLWAIFLSWFFIVAAPLTLRVALLTLLKRDRQPRTRYPRRPAPSGTGYMRQRPRV